MSTKQNVQRVVHLRSGDRLSAITKKNKLVEGPIVSIGGTSIEVMNAVNQRQIIQALDIVAIGLDGLDYLIHEPFDPDYLPGLDECNPTNNPQIFWPGEAEIIEIPSTQPTTPAPTTVKPYIPPGPDNVPWIWDHHYNPGYVGGSNGQLLQEGYVRSTSNTYTLKFSFTAQEEVEESTQTVKVKKYKYKPA